MKKNDINVKMILTVVLGLLLVVSSAIAQVTPQSTKDRRIEEVNRLNLFPTEAVIIEKKIPASPRFKKITNSLHVEQGGWATYRYMGFNNIDEDKNTPDSLTSLGILDTRYWVRWLYKPQEKDVNEHQLYVRLKDRYIRRTGDDPGGERYDIDGPHVDQAYVILDYRPFWVEAGRRYFNVGRGIVYSDVSDGVQLNFRKPGFNLGIFAAQNKPHESNIDTSIPGYDKESQRYFYGLGVGYTGIKDHALYSFLLIQRDESNPRPSTPDQDYRYNSEYIGIGSKGALSPSCHYWLELIREMGASHVFGSSARRDVKAWASDIEIIYAPQLPVQPQLSFKYAFGSGDADRGSVTDTRLGNVRGNDQNFLYFGYLPTGFALAPRLSNLHLFKVGLNITPFEHYKILKRMSLGLECYQFLKNRMDGGISDVAATQNSRDIGRELDLRLDWKINLRLSVGFEYGNFFPGHAYASSANDTARFFSLYVTHTF